MSIDSSELWVSEGLANDCDLRQLHYGVLLHRRRSEGVRTLEVFEYLPLVDSKSKPLVLPGIEPDDERIDFERGYGTPLDLRLIRRTPFRFDVSAATGQGAGSLQQAFLVVKPADGRPIDPALGLTLVTGPGELARTCPPQGLEPLRLWSTEEWKDCSFTAEATVGDDPPEWTAALGERAQRAVGARHASALQANGWPAAPAVENLRAAPTTSISRVGAGDLAAKPRPAESLRPTAALPQPMSGADRIRSATWAALAALAASTAIGGAFWLVNYGRSNATMPSSTKAPAPRPFPPPHAADVTPASVPAPTATPALRKSANPACQDHPFPLHCERQHNETQRKVPP